MARHANPRFYIGPETNELILGLGRAFGVKLSEPKPDITIDFVQRVCDPAAPMVWTAYSVDSLSQAHFQIPSLFITDIDKYPTGFYDGKVKIGDCEIADVELIKAPGHYAISADSIQEPCADHTIWVEPVCANDPTINNCGCNCQGDPGKTCTCSVKDGCPTCFNECFISKAELNEGYITLIPAVFDGSDLYTTITTVTESTVTQGDKIRWEVEVCNNGPDPTSNVIMEVELPSGLTATVVNGAVTKGNYVATGTWTIGNLGSGECHTLLIEGTTDTIVGGTIVDIVAVAASGDTPDTNVTSDTLSAPVIVGLAPFVNLVTTKTNTVGVIPSPLLDLTPGDAFSFIIEVTNAGTQDATNATLTDFIEMVTMSLVADNVTQGSYTSGTGVWDIGTITAGSTATLTLDMQTIAGAPIGYVDTNITTRAVSSEFDGTNLGNFLSSSVTYS